MEKERVCKECSPLSVNVAEDEINAAIDRLAKLKGMRFVDDATYQNRLTQCNNCRHLEGGTTCLQCGCIVQIRAKLPDSKCPYPKNPKW